jgi:eukaryotic-like serine/threonine-protein kinase
MGEVYEATHERIAGRYAVKLSHGSMSSPEERARFDREAKVTSQLRHPNIVKVIDFNLAPDGRPFLAMEFLEGVDLAEELSRNGSMRLSRVLGILRQVASALEYAHGQGIVHRDLKPQNIFITPRPDSQSEFVTVLDFGISKVRTASVKLTQDKSQLGTPQYMAPEQVEGRIADIDERTDQFALAAIAYELLTNQPAFDGDSALVVMKRIAGGPRPKLRVQEPAMPASVENAILRGLAIERGKRFANLRDFLEALGRDGNAQANTATLVRREPLQSPARRWLWLAAGVGAFALVGGAGYWAGRSPAPIPPPPAKTPVEPEASEPGPVVSPPVGPESLVPGSVAPGPPMPAPAGPAVPAPPERASAEPEPARRASAVSPLAKRAPSGRTPPETTITETAALAEPGIRPNPSWPLFVETFKGPDAGKYRASVMKSVLKAGFDVVSDKRMLLVENDLGLLAVSDSYSSVARELNLRAFVSGIITGGPRPKARVLVRDPNGKPIGGQIFQATSAAKLMEMVSAGAGRKVASVVGLTAGGATAASGNFPPPGDAAPSQIKGVLEKLNDLDRQALQDYAANDFESARINWREAITVAGRAGLAADPIMARIWANLGALYINGFRDPAKGEKSLVVAVKIMPTIQPSDQLRSPAVTVALSAAAAAPAQSVQAPPP